MIKTYAAGSRLNVSARERLEALKSPERREAEAKLKARKIERDRAFEASAASRMSVAELVDAHRAANGKPFTLREQRAAASKPAAKRPAQAKTEAPAIAAARKAGFAEATQRAVTVMMSSGAKAQPKLAAKLIGQGTLSAVEIGDILAAAGGKASAEGGAAEMREVLGELRERNAAAPAASTAAAGVWDRAIEQANRGAGQ